METTIKLVIVDDHRLFRKSLISFFLLKTKYEVIGQASNGEEFLELIKEEQPDVVFMDVRMSKMDGIEATKKAKNIYGKEIKIIALTMHEEFEYLKKMIGAGISGYLYKNNMTDMLEPAIDKVISGGMFFPKTINSY